MIYHNGSARETPSLRGRNAKCANAKTNKTRAYPSSNTHCNVRSHSGLIMGPRRKRIASTPRAGLKRRDDTARSELVCVCVRKCAFYY